MKFSDFLLENDDVRYKIEIDKDKAESLISSECKKYSNPLYRGSSDKGEFYLIEGSKGKRKSANTSNYYTAIIDHFLDESMPKRSQSTICSGSYSTASGYGTIYAIIPFDDVVIGKVPSRDIWDLEAEIGDNKYNIVDWNEIFETCKISDSSYDAIVTSLQKFLTNPDSVKDGIFKTSLIEAFDHNPDNVVPFLKKAYSPKSLGFKMIKSSKILKEDDSEHWLSGKCIAIRYDCYEEMFG